MKGRTLLMEVQDLLNDRTYSRYEEINRAYRKICRLTSWSWLLVTSLDILKFRTNVDIYPLDLSRIRVLKRIYVKRTDDQQQYELIQEAQPQLFEDKVLDSRRSDGTNDTDRPRWYKIESGILTITPIPDQNYSSRVDFIEHPAAIDSETHIQLPNGYEDTLARLAAGMIMDKPGNPPERQNKAKEYIAGAMDEFGDMLKGVYPNRTESMDRPEMTWLK